LALELAFDGFAAEGRSLLAVMAVGALAAMAEHLGGEALTIQFEAFRTLAVAFL